MKRITSVWFSGMMFTALLVAMSAAQSDSLGDYARSIRQDKPGAKPRVYDNDNLPTGDKLSVVGPAASGAPVATTQTASAAAPGTGNATSTAPKAGLSAEEQQQLNDKWKDKFSSQKDQIDLLNRELTVAQKEQQLRAAAMYADAGNRLRDSSDWDKQSAQYKSEIAEKQKALDDAKQTLEQMQEDARKDGVSSSVRDGDQDAH